MELNSFNSVNIYVKNLNNCIDVNRLVKEFSKFGTIENAIIIKNKDGISKGFGFVCFKNAEAASQAICRMNGHVIGNKKMCVSLAHCLPYPQNDSISQNIVGPLEGKLLTNSNNQPTQNYWLPPQVPTQKPLPFVPMFTLFPPCHNSPVVHQSVINSTDHTQMMNANTVHINAQPILPTPNLTSGGSHSVVSTLNIYSSSSHPMLPTLNVPPNGSQHMFPTMNVQSSGSQPLDARLNIPSTNMLLPQDTVVLSCNNTNLTDANTCKNDNISLHSAIKLPFKSASTVLRSEPLVDNKPPLGLVPAAGELSEEKEKLGNRLYMMVREYEPNLCAKITGMLLQADNKYILLMLQNPSILKENIDEAVKVVLAYRDSHQNESYLLEASVVAGCGEQKQQQQHDEKRMLGERLYLQLSVHYPDLAGKMTGMILEMNNSDIIELLDDPVALKQQADHAVALLQQQPQCINKSI